MKFSTVVIVVLGVFLAAVIADVESKADNSIIQHKNKLLKRIEAELEAETDANQLDDEPLEADLSEVENEKKELDEYFDEIDDKDKDDDVEKKELEDGFEDEKNELEENFNEEDGEDDDEEEEKKELEEDIDETEDETEDDDEDLQTRLADLEEYLSDMLEKKNMDAESDNEMNTINLDARAVSSSWKRKIVKSHNKYRGQVSPKASNMLKMSWDNAIAKMAQSWADKCTMQHTSNAELNIPGKFSLGQNLGMGHKNWDSCISSWFEERQDFQYGSSSNVFKKIGHYTAMVWAKTYKIGCGFAVCKTGNKSTNYYVCNYGPAGNVGSLINTPYKSASKSCGECKKCRQNLCSCRSSIVCSKGTSLDSMTCKCK